MASRSLKSLLPPFRDRVGEWLRLCNSKGVPALIYCTYRSPTEQARLYMKGRTTVDPTGRDIEFQDATPVEQALKWKWARSSDGTVIVTNAKPGNSMHQHRVAIDAVPFVRAQQVGGYMASKLDWSPFSTQAAENNFKLNGELYLLDKDWRIMVQMADKVGLDWSGRWKSFREYCHWEQPMDLE